MVTKVTKPYRSGNKSYKTIQEWQQKLQNHTGVAMKVTKPYRSGNKSYKTIQEW